MFLLYKIYVGINILLGGIFLWVAAQRIVPEMARFTSWNHIAFLFLLGLVLSSMTHRLPGPGRRYAIAFFTPLLLLGPALTTFLGATACLLQLAVVAARDVIVTFLQSKKIDLKKSFALSSDPGSFTDEKSSSLTPHLFGIVQAAIAIMCAGSIYLTLGGQIGRVEIPESIGPILATAIFLYFSEVVLAETAVALKLSRPLLASWRNGLIYSLPVAGALTGLGLLLVLLYQRADRVNFSLLIVVIPCWLLYYSFRLYLEMRGAYERTLRTLAGLVDIRIHSATHFHSDIDTKGVAQLGERASHIGTLSTAVAEQMGLSPKDVEQIRFASYLLDVGKMGLPRRILSGNSFVSPRQRKTYLHHAIIGSQILDPVDFLRPVAHLIRHQQERYDGLGYPDGLRGDTIPVGARILAATHAFIEMTEGRESSSGVSIAEAIEQLNASRGIRFDPKVIDCLINVVANHGLLEHPTRQRLSATAV